MTANRTRLLYVAYIVLVTIFFIYWQFPEEAVRSYLSFKLKTVHPDMNLGVVRIKPTFPPGLKLEKINISYKNISIADIAEFKIGPVLTSFYRPGSSFFFRGNLYGGTIAGRLDIATDNSKHAIVMNSTFSGIRIDQSAGLQGLLKRKISGMLGGEVQFESKPGESGMLSAGLTLSDGKVEISASVFGREDLSFKDISADITAEKKMVRIKAVTLRGNQMDGKLNGTVELKEPVRNSRLNLSGSLRLHHQFLADLQKRLPLNVLSKKRPDNQTFPIQFVGTIDSPVFSLN